MEFGLHKFSDLFYDERFLWTLLGSPPKADAPLAQNLRPILWWALLGSNQRPADYESAALTN